MSDPEVNNYKNNNPYYGSTGNKNDLKNDWQEAQYGNNSDEALQNTWDTKMRLGFIRKVYGIVCLQMITTAIFCLISMNSASFKAFQIQNIAIFWVCLVATVISSIALICFRSLARNFPVNYLLLGTFTLCESYLVSFICASTKPSIVVMAALMTAAIVIALTIYAYTTKTDFTVMGGMMFIIGCIVLLFGLFCMFSRNPILHIIYSCLGVFCFSLYLIYDTQLIVGNHENKLDIDDYIVGALMLYMDIINLFLHILSLLSKIDSS
jgi:FtsH-binding integral membrane protein